MPCETWKVKLDTYLDGELPSEEMRTFDAHVHSCPSCAADALARVQMKRGIQAAGKRFAPSAEFRRRIQGKIATKPQRSFRLSWMFAAALSTLAVASMLTAYVGVQRSHRQQAYGEIADLHVGGAGQLIASRCGVHRSPHREALVSRKDPLRLRFAGSPELRIYPPRRPHDLRRSITRRTFDLHRAQARNFCVRLPGRRVPAWMGRKLFRDKRAVIQHRNLEPRRTSLFRNRRRKRCRYQQSRKTVQSHPFLGSASELALSSGRAQ